MQEQNKFPKTELSKIDKADDLRIAPFREDGKTTGTPTWIWEVAVDGELYVRAYNGVNSRWYNAAIEQKAGRIFAADGIYDVAFEPIKGIDINDTIDEAYKKKYSGSPYLSAMISERTRAATVRVYPK